MKRLLFILALAFPLTAKSATPLGTATNPPVVQTAAATFTIQTGVTTTFNSGSITTFASGSTVNFTGATVNGLNVGGLPFVSLKHKDGSTTAYQPASSTDAARGTAFKAANTAAVSGDTLLFSGPIDMGTDGITIKDGVTYFGLGSTITLNNAAGATKNIFIDNGASVQCRIGGNIRFEAFGGTGAETIRAIYATGDGTIIHVAPTVEFETQATGDVLMPSLQAASGATIYADGVLIQDGTVVVESGGSISINHAKLFDCNIASAGDLYAAGIESLDGKISITAGDAYLDNVNIFSPGEFPALTVSGSAVVYGSGRFRANGTNSNAITVGPSTILTLNGGTDLIATGSGKAIGKSSGTPTVTLRGAVRGNAAADVAIIFAGGTDIGNLYQAYDADLTTWAGITPGTGVGTALAINIGSAGAFVTFNGALGTPSGGTGTNLTGIPESGVTNLVSDLALKSPLASPTFTGVPAAPTATGGTNTTQLATTAFVTSAVSTAGGSYQPLDSDLTSWAAITRASGFDTFTTTPSSANLKSLVTDETGSGALVFGTSPTFTTGITIGAGSAITSSGAGGTVATLAGTEALTNKTYNGTTPTTAGLGILGVTNPSAISFVKIAADNSVSTRTPAQVLSDIGAQASGSYAASGANSDITSLSGVTGITGGASNMTITSGTGNSRTMILRTTTSGGTATTALTLGADQSPTFAGTGNFLTAASDLTSTNFSSYDTGANAVARTISGRTMAVNGSGSSYGIVWGAGAAIRFTPQVAGAGSDAANGGNTDAVLSRNAAGILQFGTTTTNALGSWLAANGTLSGTLAVTGASTLTGAVGIGADTTVTGGNVIVATAGKGLQVKGGTNAKIGSGTLTAGTVTISTTAVTANSRIFLTDTSTGSLVNVGSLVVSTKTAGSGFVVTSTNALDASTFDWMIVEQN